MKFFISMRSKKQTNNKKIIVVLFLAFFIFLAAGAPLKPAKAIPVEDIPAFVWNKVTSVLTKVLKKAGSIAFQRTLSTALNKIAYDAATYIGSGGEGQSPLYVKQDLGDYLKQVGDEAAGTFIESFVNNLNREGTEDCNSSLFECQKKCRQGYDITAPDAAATHKACQDKCSAQSTACASKKTSSYATAMRAAPSFNVCQPSSLEAKLRIALGLTQYNRPQGPNCTASEMIANWSEDINQKIEDLQDPNFLDNFSNIFDPAANDLGIYLLARTDLSSKAIIDTETSKTGYIAKGGWLDVRNIAGESEGAPNQAERDLEQAQALQQSQFGKVTGDILVDSANIFLNQLALTAFSNITKNLTKAGTGITSGGASSGSTWLESQADPSTVYGEGAVSEITSKLLRPQFGSQADYDILSDLAVCLDKENPAPNNCAIDTKFMQAVSEKKTVAEALKGDYLHGDWQLTTDNRNDSYNNSYALRNISILRQYRILPVGWETAAAKITEINQDRTEKNKTRTEANQLPLLKVTLNDLVSCFNPNDEYSDFSTDFNTRDQSWCQGLIDPNWVLKAPLNYCKKEGISAQILNKTVTPGIEGQSGVADTPSELNIVRADGYCADGQTCIKEKSDGSCEVYGYCNEEKRTWNFGQDSCEPVYNTCQSFANTTNGQTVSYLENTLDYGDCNPENSGCRQYSLLGTYATSTGIVSWSTASSLYLNKSLGTCGNEDEGCSEFLRVKPTWGSNLVMNADFVNDQIGDTTTGPMLNSWFLENTTGALIVNASQEPGGTSGKALKIEVDGITGGLLSNAAHSLLPADFQIFSGQAYTVSADIYLTRGDDVTLFVGAVADGFVTTTSNKNAWAHLNITRPAGSGYSEPNFGISAKSASGSSTFYVKNLKFEISNWDTGYKPYGLFKVYERILPAYLEKSCYQNTTSAIKDYSLKSDAPFVCSNYARKCNQGEVGCELFTAAKDGFAVPAKVSSSDYCASQCVGYDVYVSKASYFNLAVKENLIPSTATACSAEAAGCNEFTNLDAIAQGGEQKEYYTSLKQCIKPSTTACASFYTWEGTGNGYQLKAYNLKKENDGAPAVVSDDSASCNAAIYNLAVSDPAYNPDCREFYSAAGQVSYHLLSRTVTCSDNCHAYRLSEKNAGNICLNGGVWDATHQACLYQAIPGEGKKCQASENGCREYNGNTGNNVRLISYHDFENGVGAWSSNCVNGISVSTVSNNRNGHSLQYNNSATNCAAIGEAAPVPVVRRLIKRIFAGDNIAAQLEVGYQVTQGSSYTVKFLARAAADTNVSFYFLNKDTQERVYFNGGAAVTVKGANEWNLYQVNLDNLNQTVSANEILIMTATNNFFLDNLILSEITDRYYLIKNSSQISAVCYYDVFNNYRGADYNLGCAQYFDRDNLKHNLHKFSALCAESAVGCEQMIATQNYAPTGGGIWNDTNTNGICDFNETDCVKVSGDRALYAVYDAAKQCNAADLGCSRLGEGQGGGTLTAWSDVFKLNNPNKYEQTLCQSKNIGCEEWRHINDNGLSYFKNPGNAVCLYRASKDPALVGQAWYKVPVKRCDTNGDKKIDGSEQGTKTCLNDNDCGGQSCLIDNNDYPCSVSYLKTVGPGGVGNQVPTPDKDAGLCTAISSGCTEYIDPVSRFSANLIFNSNFTATGDTNGNNSCDAGETNCVHEGWGTSTPDRWNNATLQANQQVVGLEANKLYSLTVIGSTGEVTLNFLNPARQLKDDNTFDAAATNLNFSFSRHDQAIIFNSLNNKTALVSGGNSNKDVIVKELVVNYQLQSEIDQKSCHGVANFDNGCILFNERGVNGASGVANLDSGWNAYATADGQTPQLCDTSHIGACNANTLVKVRPDRVCAKWLDCVTYGLDASGQKICYAVGECNRLNDKNECGNYLGSTDTPQIHSFSKENDKNSTGYALLDKYYLGSMKEVGVNTDAHFDFETRDLNLSCYTGGTGSCVFGNLTKELLVLEPAGAPTDYPAHGSGYLKVPGRYQISPLAPNGGIRVYTGQDYYLNYLVNTKNSGLKAKIMIVDADNPAITIASFIDDAGSGWTRKVHKFNIISATKSEKRINIYLTSNTGEDKYIYFDDINIEPVLQIGNNKKADGTDDEDKNYVAKDCRLYSEESSLTCESYNNNVVTDGLYGYCLQYDSYNPNVCAIWYPIDKIGSTGRANQNALGYKGKFPLYYCTEVDGNFQLAKKIKATWIGECKRPNKESTCTSGSLRALEWYAQDSAHNNCGGEYDNYYVYLKYADQVAKYCGDSVNYDILGTHEQGEKKGSEWWDFYCIPKESAALIEGELIDFDYYTENINTSLQDNSGCVDNVSFLEDAWVTYDNGFIKKDALTGGENVDPINEAKNSNPPVAIWTSGTNSEEDLKFISGSDEDVYRIKCNRFAQLVNEAGGNKAWVDRVSINSSYPITTPSFFNYGVTPTASYSTQIKRYGRSREDVPFGAAIFPNGFQLSSFPVPIYLRNQYSNKNNEDVLAGRPYGCSTSGSSAADGCYNIGQCSLDPNVFCFYTSNPDSDYNINVKSCANGGYGTCESLWSSNPLYTRTTNSDSHNILKTLFLEQYSYYKYTIGMNGGYLPDSDGSFDWNNNGVISDCSGTGSARSGNTFCAVWPKIENVALNNGVTSLSGAAPYGGLYTLTFTTTVDKEQQPLKQIVIAWNSDDIQVITGEDNRSLASQPHTFYHYYAKGENYNIQVKIFDNWDKYRCSKAGSPLCP